VEKICSRYDGGGAAVAASTVFTGEVGRRKEKGVKQTTT